MKHIDNKTDRCTEHLGHTDNRTVKENETRFSREVPGVWDYQLHLVVFLEIASKVNF